MQKIDKYFYENKCWKKEYMKLDVYALFRSFREMESERLP